jgi:hypothetical protein
VGGGATGVRFEYEVAIVQHVCVDRGEGRPPAADPLTGETEQLGARNVVQMSGAERPDHLRRVGHARYRLPSTAVRWSVSSFRLAMISTVSPA